MDYFAELLHLIIYTLVSTLDCLHGFLEEKAGKQGHQSTDKKHQKGIPETREGKTAGRGKSLAVQHSSQYDLKYGAAEKGKKVD